jgi:hypothetical protein
MRKTAAILLLALTCAVFASCSRDDAIAPRANEDQDRSTSEATPQEPPVGTQPQQNENWTILTKSDLAAQGYTEDLEGMWQPSESDVPRAIREARPYLEKLKKTTSSKMERVKADAVLSADWDRYYACQAYGCTKDGRKLICLSFFPKGLISRSKEEGVDWRHQFVAAIDGGASFWVVSYDNETKTFSGFNTNRHVGEDEDTGAGVGNNLY